MKTVEQILGEIEAECDKSPEEYYHSEAWQEARYYSEEEEASLNYQAFAANTLPRLLKAFRVLWEANEFYQNTDNWFRGLNLSQFKMITHDDIRNEAASDIGGKKAKEAKQKAEKYLRGRCE